MNSNLVAHPNDTSVSREPINGKVVIDLSHSCEDKRASKRLAISKFYPYFKRKIRFILQSIH